MMRIGLAKKSCAVARPACAAMSVEPISASSHRAARDGYFIISSQTLCAIHLSRKRPGVRMNILILEGDGIGPEISAAAVRVMTRTNEVFSLGMDFSTMPIGFAAMAKSKTTFPKETLEAAHEAGGTV